MHSVCPFPRSCSSPDAPQERPLSFLALRLDEHPDGQPVTLASAAAPQALFPSCSEKSLQLCLLTGSQPPLPPAPCLVPTNTLSEGHSGSSYCLNSRLYSLCSLFLHNNL